MGVSYCFIPLDIDATPCHSYCLAPGTYVLTFGFRIEHHCHEKFLAWADGVGKGYILTKNSTRQTILNKVPAIFDYLPARLVLELITNDGINSLLG